MALSKETIEPVAWVCTNDYVCFTPSHFGKQLYVIASKGNWRHKKNNIRVHQLFGTGFKVHTK